MRYAKRNFKIFSISICIAILTTIVGGMRNVSHYQNNAGTVSALEHVIGKDLGCSIGYRYGNIYSIDGESIACKYEKETDEGIETKYGAIYGYNPVIGSENGGLICELKNILLASVDESNRLARTGDSVMTTLHSAGMKAAINELSVYGGSDVVQAGITVVLQDGAILVDAGNNIYSSDAFWEPENYNDLFVDYNNASFSKGSSFKPSVYRMLLEYDEELDDEFSVYNNDFFDISYVDISGNRIHNWDFLYPENYNVSEGNRLYSRSADLSKVLQLSSNTSVVLRTQNLGFAKSYEYMKEMYGLDKNLVTEISTLDSIGTNAERLPYLYFGQDSYISATRLCQISSYIFSGNFFAPFYVCSVIQPDGHTIYKASPTAKEEYTLSIDLKDDILKEALCDCFESYVNQASLADEFGDEIIYGRRLLCKSGSAENGDGTDNRIMMMSILSEDGLDVLASACISVNHTSNSISNEELIHKLLVIVQAIGLI